jgi:RNA polymerase sigma factor (sigma-70 family)
MSFCNMAGSDIFPFAPPETMTDEMLVKAAQAGEQRAFVELCARYSKRVFHTIYNVTKNREDAEDALQDSMLRAFQHLKQFDGRSSFATWFTRIGINSALMILRKKRIRQETSMDLPLEGEEWHTWQPADHSADPEKYYFVSERSHQLQRAIGSLPGTLRSVIERGQLEGHSMKQIARTMGISVPATKSRLARAKVALRKSMVTAKAHGASAAPGLASFPR